MNGANRPRSRNHGGLVAVGAWFFARRGGQPSPPPEQKAVAEVRLDLDLRPYAVSRGETNAPGQPPLVLSTRRLAMSLLMPVGSEPGAYELRLLGVIQR